LVEITLLYEYKRKTILYLCIWNMFSGKNAKIDNRKHNRHNDDDDSDATITDDEYDGGCNTITAPYSVLPSDEDRETIINDALDELADIARENILEFKREDFNDDRGRWNMD